MIIKNPKFELTAVSPSQYPANNIPEVALVGRSNAGKSSIINTLLNRKSLAYTGSKPGKTREINFYNVDNRLYFVDLPGYGYAGVSRTVKATWSTVVETYLNSRRQLSLVLLLVDIRHTPTEDDILISQWLLHNNVPFIVAATKSDKLTRSQIQPRLHEIAEALQLSGHARPIPYSSVTKQGRDEIWELIEPMVLTQL